MLDWSGYIRGGLDLFEGLSACTSSTSLIPYNLCWPDWFPVRPPRANPLLPKTFSLSCAFEWEQSWSCSAEIGRQRQRVRFLFWKMESLGGFGTFYHLCSQQPAQTQYTWVHHVYWLPPLSQLSFFLLIIKGLGLTWGFFSKLSLKLCKLVDVIVLLFGC